MTDEALADLRGWLDEFRNGPSNVTHVHTDGPSGDSFQAIRLTVESDPTQIDGEAHMLAFAATNAGGRPVVAYKTFRGSLARVMEDAKEWYLSVNKP